MKETSKISHAKAQWTLKVATLKGNLSTSGIVEFSLHDNKPFYFMSNSCEIFKWNKMTRKEWSKLKNRMVEMPFFRFNLIHDYNIGMNAIYLADQIRNTYRWDIFMRKRKWWWSIMMWCLQMLLDNLYVFYKKYMKMNDLKAISHFYFDQLVCMGLIDPGNHCTKKKRTHQA